MVNRWVTRMSPPFAEWEMRLPAISDEAGVGTLLKFVTSFLEIGHREDVYRIMETRGPDAFRLDSGQTYTDYLRQATGRLGFIPLFTLGFGVAPTDAGLVRTPGRVCFYDSRGEMVEEEVENSGRLLASLRPQDVAEAGSRCMASMAPLTVMGEKVYTGNGHGPNDAAQRPIRVKVSLQTDIWFPRVLGILEDVFPAPNEEGMYDNRELALCHTPRLNRFLAGVQELVTEAGGEWELLAPEGSAEHYAGMVSENGISLSH